MNKLQAAGKDRSAASWRERKVMYKVGSYFRGCRNCGDTEWVELPSGKEVERWLTGTDVFQAYKPSWSGFTYCCWSCGAKDLRCWDIATDIGLDALVGTRDAVRAVRADRRREAARAERAESRRDEVKAPSRAAEIEALERKIAELEAVLKGGR